MIEEILSPDLQLQRRRDESRTRRLEALKRFRPGDKVKAGSDGFPGLLEHVSDQGFASIRWPGGWLLCGIPGDELVHVAD